MGNSTELAPTLPSTKEAPGTPFHFQLPLWASICIQQNGPSPWPVVLRIVAQGQVTTLVCLEVGTECPEHFMPTHFMLGWPLMSSEGHGFAGGGWVPRFTGLPWSGEG